MRTANPYYVSGQMRPMQLNHVFNLEINGETVEVADSIILKAVPSGTTKQVYNVYYEYDLGYIYLNAGENTVTLVVHNTEHGEMTSWEEAPCSLNVDYIRLETFAHEHETTKVNAVPADCTNAGAIEHYVCKHCGAKFADAAGETYLDNIVVDALGHDWSDWSKTSKEHSRTCKRTDCGANEHAEHTLQLGKIEGEHKQICSVCGYNETYQAEVSYKIVSSKSIYNVGDVLSDVSVQKICECGDVLETVECTITVDGQAAATTPLKLNSNVKIVYNDGTKDVTVENPFTIQHKFEYEAGTPSGITIGTKELEKFRFVDGQLVSEGNAVVGNDIMLTKKADMATANKQITFTFDAAVAGKAKLFIDIANCNWRNGMKDYDLSKVFSLVVNGTPVAISADAILPQFTSSTIGGLSAFDAAFQVFFLVDLGEIDLKEGVNTITFKLDVKDETNYNEWNQIAGNKIDYFAIEWQN